MFSIPQCGVDSSWIKGNSQMLRLLLWGQDDPTAVAQEWRKKDIEEKPEADELSS
jgi:hypothetical protein